MCDDRAVGIFTHWKSLPGIAGSTIATLHRHDGETSPHCSLLNKISERGMMDNSLIFRMKWGGRGELFIAGFFPTPSNHATTRGDDQNSGRRVMLGVIGEILGRIYCLCCNRILERSNSSRRLLSHFTTYPP